MHYAHPSVAEGDAPPEGKPARCSFDMAQPSLFVTDVDDPEVELQQPRAKITIGLTPLHRRGWGWVIDNSRCDCYQDFDKLSEL